MSSKGIIDDIKTVFGFLVDMWLFAIFSVIIASIIGITLYFAIEEIGTFIGFLIGLIVFFVLMISNIRYRYKK